MHPLCFTASVAHATDTVLDLDGIVPTGPPDHFLVAFDVPPGTQELEVRHDDGSEVDILDWGLLGPDGEFRGWGGGNTEPAIVTELAASRSYVPGALAPGTWAVLVGEAKVVTPSLRWSIQVVLRDAPTLAPQPERRPFVDPGALRSGREWYAGDFHVHSRESGDAVATLDEIAALAVERGLDFVVITDHDTTTSSDFLGDVQARWPELLFVPGTEYTTYQGHATAFGATRWVDHRLGTDGLTIDDAVESYAAAGVFFSINHPALELGELCIGCAWNLPVPSGVGGIEVATGAAEPAGLIFTPLAVARWEELAAGGQLLAPIGGSDDHRAGTDTGFGASRIGTPVTRVLADELSIDALSAALGQQDTVVQLRDRSDPMVELTVADQAASVRVWDAEGGEIRYVVNGVVARTVPVGSSEFVDTLQGTPGQRVRVEVWTAGVLRSLSGFRSFSAAAVRPPDDPGDGCGGCRLQPVGLSGVWGAVSLVVGLLRRRTRGGSGRGQEYSTRSWCLRSHLRKQGPTLAACPPEETQ